MRLEPLSSSPSRLRFRFFIFVPIGLHNASPFPLVVLELQP